MDTAAIDVVAAVDTETDTTTAEARMAAVMITDVLIDTVTTVAIMEATVENEETAVTAVAIVATVVAIVVATEAMLTKEHHAQQTATRVVMPEVLVMRLVTRLQPAATSHVVMTSPHPRRLELVESTS